MREREKIAIPYDNETIRLKIPSGNIGSVVGGESPDVPGGDVIEQALRNSSEPDLRELANNRRVGLVVADATREVPLEKLLQAVMPCLRPVQELRLFIATGTHAPDMPGNSAIAEVVRQAASEYGIALREIIYHDSLNASWTHVGRTASHQNDIFVNAACHH